MMKGLVSRLALIVGLSAGMLGYSQPAEAQHRGGHGEHGMSKNVREGIGITRLGLDILSLDTRTAEQRKEDARRVAEAMAPRVYVVVNNEEGKPRIPEHTLMDADGNLHPENGFRWENNAANDYRVKKIEESEGKIDIKTCEKYEDKNKNGKFDLGEQLDEKKDFKPGDNFNYLMKPDFNDYVLGRFQMFVSIGDKEPKLAFDEWRIFKDDEVRGAMKVPNGRRSGLEVRITVPAVNGKENEVYSHKMSFTGVPEYHFFCL